MAKSLSERQKWRIQCRTGKRLSVRYTGRPIAYLNNWNCSRNAAECRIVSRWGYVVQTFSAVSDTSRDANNAIVRDHWFENRTALFFCLVPQTEIDDGAFRRFRKKRSDAILERLLTYRRSTHIVPLVVSRLFRLIVRWCWLPNRRNSKYESVRFARLLILVLVSRNFGTFYNYRTGRLAFVATHSHKAADVNYNEWNQK